MNPIEEVWSALKNYVTHKVRPRTMAELVAGIRQYWREEMDEETCRRFIRRMGRKIDLVIRNRGYPTTGMI